ncbi:hypothetical protein B0H13DRAFT_2415319 [Mycena leptocephala]|nr:hypothetical protein B0H13DRAFT_2415319 [Mycena leptocephala]
MWEHEGECSRVVGQERRDAGLISDDEECKMKCEAALSPLVEIDARIVQRGGWKHPPQSRRHLINKRRQTQARTEVEGMKWEWRKKGLVYKNKEEQRIGLGRDRDTNKRTENTAPSTPLLTTLSFAQPFSRRRRGGGDGTSSKRRATQSERKRRKSQKPGNTTSANREKRQDPPKDLRIRRQIRHDRGTREQDLEGDQRLDAEPDGVSEVDDVRGEGAQGAEDVEGVERKEFEVKRRYETQHPLDLHPRHTLSGTPNVQISLACRSLARGACHARAGWRGAAGENVFDVALGRMREERGMEKEAKDTPAMITTSTPPSCAGAVAAPRRRPGNPSPYPCPCAPSRVLDGPSPSSLFLLRCRVLGIVSDGTYARLTDAVSSLERVAARGGARTDQPFGSFLDALDPSASVTRDFLGIGSICRMDFGVEGRE